jgi:CRP-like cAMP-binding protein
MLPATQRNRDQPHAWSFEPGHSPPFPMLAQTAGFGRTEVFRTGATIYSQEDPADYVYQVSAGIVRTTKLASDGRRVVRGFHVPGEIFGTEGGGAYTCSAEAVCDTYLVRLSRARLDTVAAYDRAVGQELLSWLLLNGDHVAQRLLLLGRGSAIEKLAYFLLDLAERLSVHRRLEVPMSRSDIGDYLGLSSETVSRTFTTLREKGLISLDGRFVMLLDVKALRALAGD